jgi:hypothetical protein
MCCESDAGLYGSLLQEIPHRKSFKKTKQRYLYSVNSTFLFQNCATPGIVPYR